MEEEEKEQYPYKKDFITRFLYSSEYLDIGSIRAALYNRPIVEQNKEEEHEYVLCDAFDVNEDDDSRNAIFDKVIK